MQTIEAPSVAQFNFALKQGADTTISMTWLDDNGRPMDLTDFYMKLSIRSHLWSTNPLLTIESGPTTGSRIDLGGTTGGISFVFARADTVFALTGCPVPSNSLYRPIKAYRLGVYDLQYTDPSGDVDYLFEGAVTLDPRITI